MPDPDLFTDFPPPPSDGPYARPSAGAARRDITARKHGGNAQSVAANERVAPHKESMRAGLLRMIAARGACGATVEELSEVSKMRYTSASACVSEMLRDGVILRTERTRKTSGGSDAAVLVAAGVPQKG